MGAFISVLMRMSSNSFRVDYEVGRSTTDVSLGKAEQTIAPSIGGASAKRRRERDTEEDQD